MTKTINMREFSLDATQNLLDSLNSNNYPRIRSALARAKLDLNYHDPLSGLETLLMRISRLEVQPKYRYDIMKMVLDSGKVDVNARDVNGLSAIAHACKVGDDSLVSLLAGDPDVDPNLEDEDGNTPLIHACRTGKTIVVSTLITCFGTSSLNVDHANHDGMTPLMEAARLGYTDVCRTLVSQGHADVSLRCSTNNFTAKDYAVEHGSCHTPDILLLDLVAQRKLRAREAREAMGRSILNDLCPEVRLQKLGLSTTQTMTPFDQSAKQIRHLPLSKEYIEQMNSIVFRIGRNVERVPEDIDGEEREEQLDDYQEVPETGKRPTRRRRLSFQNTPVLIDKPPKVRQRRGSLPVSVGAGGSLLNLNREGTGAKETDMPNKAKPQSDKTLRLPRVARTAKGAPQNLSTTPSSSSYLSSSPPESSFSFSHSSQTTPKSKTMSPRRSASRTSFPFTSQSTPRKTSREQNQTHLSASKARSAGSKTGNWEGKASTSVPSYLFR